MEVINTKTMYTLGTELDDWTKGSLPVLTSADSPYRIEAADSLAARKDLCLAFGSGVMHIHDTKPHLGSHDLLALVAAMNTPTCLKGSPEVVALAKFYIQKLTSLVAKTVNTQFKEIIPFMETLVVLQTRNDLKVTLKDDSD